FAKRERSDEHGGRDGEDDDTTDRLVPGRPKEERGDPEEADHDRHRHVEESPAVPLPLQELAAAGGAAHLDRVEAPEELSLAAPRAEAASATDHRDSQGGSKARFGRHLPVSFRRRKGSRPRPAAEAERWITSRGG